MIRVSVHTGQQVRERTDEMDDLAASDAEAQERDRIDLDTVDDWIADIDEALGEEAAFAQTFVREFLQKPGE